MSYRIYIGEGCHDCEKVLDWIKSQHLDVTVIDADDPGNLQPPFAVFARPALFKNNELLAYGMDIVDYFKTNNA